MSCRKLKKVVPSFFRKSGCTCRNDLPRVSRYLGSHALNHSRIGTDSLLSRERSTDVRNLRVNKLTHSHIATSFATYTAPPMSSAPVKPFCQMSLKNQYRQKPDPPNAAMQSRLTKRNMQPLHQFFWFFCPAQTCGAFSSGRTLFSGRGLCLSRRSGSGSPLISTTCSPRRGSRCATFIGRIRRSAPDELDSKNVPANV